MPRGWVDSQAYVSCVSCFAGRQEEATCQGDGQTVEHMEFELNVQPLINHVVIWKCHVLCWLTGGGDMPRGWAEQSNTCNLCVACVMCFAGWQEEETAKCVYYTHIIMSPTLLINQVLI